MKDQVLISVVIPCYNEVAFIEKCVKSVSVSLRASKVSGEIFVVDGQSTDGTRELLSRLQNSIAELTVLDNPDRFTPKALNMGIEKAEGSLINILGAHSIVSVDYIEKNIQAFDKQPKASCVGGRIVNEYENDVSRAIGLAMSSGFGVGNARFRTGGSDGFVDTVAFGTYKREVFDKVGLFDEKLVRNQDDEFNYRMTRAGMQIFYTSSIVTKYLVRSDLKKLFRQYFQYGYWKVVVNRKHKRITSWRQVVPMLMVLGWLSFPISMTLPASFPVLSVLTLIHGSLLLLYLVLLFGQSMRLAMNNQAKVADVASGFLVLHFGYGLGYLKALVTGKWLFTAVSERQTKSTR